MTSRIEGVWYEPETDEERGTPPARTVQPTSSKAPPGEFDFLLSEQNLDRAVNAAREALERSKLERAASPALVDRLERLPSAQARLLIDNDSRFSSWGLVEELMDRAESAVFEAGPRRTTHLARLATLAADRVDPGPYGGSLTNDLRARSWACLGNAYRYGSRFRAAAAALARAAKLLTQGTGDPLEEAHLLSIRASLALSTGDYDESLTILARAEAIYSELGESRLLAKILVQRAGTVGSRDPFKGAALSVRAEQNLDEEKDPRLLLMARHNRILMLIEAGETAQAQCLLDRSLHLYHEADDEWTFLHLAWAEARLSAGARDHREAEACFEVLLTELLDRRHQLDAALCALELAGCYLAQGRTRKASELAGAMAHHLREWGAHARAREAWAVLQHALGVEQATDDLLRQLARYLYRAWRNPRLAFSSQT